MQAVAAWNAAVPPRWANWVGHKSLSVYWLNADFQLLQRTQPSWPSCPPLLNLNAVRITSTPVSQFLRILFVCIESTEAFSQGFLTGVDILLMIGMWKRYFFMNRDCPDLSFVTPGPVSCCTASCTASRSASCTACCTASCTASCTACLLPLVLPVVPPLVLPLVLPVYCLSYCLLYRLLYCLSYCLSRRPNRPWFLNVC